MNVTVIIKGNATAEVHKAGCIDIARTVREADYTFSAASQVEVG